jgi:NodT family efflux transporter outer membrane factor (OMF) lipoprotein
VNSRILSFILCAAVFTGCAVGPDFHPPPAPEVKNYLETSLPDETAEAEVICGEAQCFLQGENIPEEWWTLFHSRELDDLVRLALTENPSAAAGQAALRQAQENFRAQFGATRLPRIDASLSAAREKVSGASYGGGSSTFELYNSSVKVSYLFDIFGGSQRELEALKAEVDYQRFQLHGTYLTLTANVITSAIQEASLRARLKATHEILKDQEQAYELVKNQFELGAISRNDVLSQETQLAQTRAGIPPLEKALSQSRHRLAVLVGKFPGEAGSLPEFDLEHLELPAELPVNLPSALVRQRPDIRAAEALLHAASAQVGVATANLYPQITISGSYGLESDRSSSLFNGNSAIWSIGTGLLQPLFNGGELRARKRAAVAAYEQALAFYRETVLNGFLNVADALRALESDARALKAQLDVEKSASDTLELTGEQFKLGAVNYLSLLDAQRQYQVARINLILAQAERFSDTVALFQAMGGGWWNPFPATEE